MYGMLGATGGTVKIWGWKFFSLIKSYASTGCHHDTLFYQHRQIQCYCFPFKSVAGNDKQPIPLNDSLRVDLLTAFLL